MKLSNEMDHLDTDFLLSLAWEGETVKRESERFVATKLCHLFSGVLNMIDIMKKRLDKKETDARTTRGLSKIFFLLFSEVRYFLYPGLEG